MNRNTAGTVEIGEVMQGKFRQDIVLNSNIISKKNIWNCRIDTQALDGTKGQEEDEYFEGIHGAVKHGLLATFSPLQFQSKYLPTMMWFYVENLSFLIGWFVFTRKVCIFVFSWYFKILSILLWISLVGIRQRSSFHSIRSSSDVYCDDIVLCIYHNARGCVIPDNARVGRMRGQNSKSAPSLCDYAFFPYNN